MKYLVVTRTTVEANSVDQAIQEAKAFHEIADEVYYLRAEDDTCTGVNLNEPKLRQKVEIDVDDFIAVTTLVDYDN